MTPEVKPPRVEPQGGRERTSGGVPSTRPVPGLASPDRVADAAGENFDRLREIILGREQEAIRRLEQRLDDPVGLSPVVERALNASVRRDPRPLADALFPVMGPAIRRAISQAMAGMLQSVNTALEQSFSLQGLAWRWEAFRSGTSYPEVVLRHTLLYRVEQVFLVHRESGLLLQHLTAPSIAAQPPDMVAGMLTAIQDFARDSFQVAPEEMLETMQIGGLTVWIEQGGRALLAAVIRGHAPVELRAELQRTLEEIEAQHAPELTRFDGDASVFARSRPKLEALLLTERRASAEARRSHWRSWLLLLGALVLLLAWGIPALIRHRRWERLVSRLRDEPGLVVTHVAREGGHYVLRGLRDPMATDPAALVAEFRLDSGTVRTQWQPYVALLPGFVLRRAERALVPPGSITLQVAADTLIAYGAASEAWFQRAAVLGPALSGVGTYLERRIAPRDLPALAPTIAELEGRRVLFASGSARLDSTARREAEGLAQALLNFDSVATRMGLTLQATLAGSADEVGDEDVNDQLRWHRAEAVREIMAPRLPGWLSPAVASLPLETGPAPDEAARAGRRSVRVQVLVGVPSGEGGS